MRTIWKFAMQTFRETFSIPRRSTFLTTQLQDDVPTLWFEVDSEAATEQREFVVCGTGGPLPQGNRKYLGTFQKGWFVGHIYEVPALSEGDGKR